MGIGFVMDLRKKNAGEKALDYVRDGMKLGLGTGSTVAYFVEALGRAVRDGLKITGTPTSEATAAQCRALGIPVAELDALAPLDLCVDGADEIDPHFHLIKGGGAALLKEKIVARQAKQFVVIADEGKYVPTLGRFALPVEIVRFGSGATQRLVREALGVFSPQMSITVRMSQNTSEPLITEEGHLILDCAMEKITNPTEVAEVLSQITGVVEHGLFVNMADVVLLGSEQGCRVLTATA